ncbi:MAG: hypothetical protein HKN25_10355 [Pyrinomonadaceae bacterium]|nr:hypothetical protein [Pyrinomonadaceae bacterium]
MRTTKLSKSVLQTSSYSLLLLMVIFGSAAPTYGYEEDTHFLMTYVICRSVGMTDEEALIVAAVDQGMDDSKRVNAHDNGKPQVEEEWRWHALDKDGKMGAKGVIARRDMYFKEAIEESDPHNRLIRLGIFFHYQQDTWAHRHHEKENHLSRDNFTTFNTPTGHGPWGSKPDRPPLDPVAALMCLEDGIVFATEFVNKALKREPTAFLSDYKPAGGQIDKKWKDKRKGKYFNQIDLSSTNTGSARHYLTRLIAGQINAYTRSRDFNPFYVPRKTPDLVDFESVRSNLQSVCDTYQSSIGSIVVPSKEQKLAQGFTNTTTQGLLNLAPDKTYKIDRAQ